MHRMEDIPAIQTIPAGVIGFAASVTLAQFNTFIASVAGILTVLAMAFRVWREISYWLDERKLCRKCKGESLKK